MYNKKEAEIQRQVLDEIVKTLHLAYVTDWESYKQPNTKHYELIEQAALLAIQKTNSEWQAQLKLFKTELKKHPLIAKEDKALALITLHDLQEQLSFYGFMSRPPRARRSLAWKGKRKLLGKEG